MLKQTLNTTHIVSRLHPARTVLAMRAGVALVGNDDVIARITSPRVAWGECWLSGTHVLAVLATLRDNVLDMQCAIHDTAPSPTQSVTLTLGDGATVSVHSRRVCSRDTRDTRWQAVMESFDAPRVCESQFIVTHPVPSVPSVPSALEYAIIEHDCWRTAVRVLHLFAKHAVVTFSSEPVPLLRLSCLLTPYPEERVDVIAWLHHVPPDVAAQRW